MLFTRPPVLLAADCWIFSVCPSRAFMRTWARVASSISSIWSPRPIESAVFFQGHFINVDAVLFECRIVPADVVLDHAQGLGVIHGKGVAEVIGKGRGGLGQLCGRVPGDAHFPV